MIAVFAITTEDKRSKNAEIEKLLASIADGDSASMGRLYDLIKTDVFAYALSKTGNKTDADDVTQDTFVQIYKHAKQYKPKGKPMAWIITIELNLVRRQYQLKARLSGYDENLENKPSGYDFEKEVVNGDFLRYLMRTLNKSEQEVITLHVVSGLKHREIAKLTEKPLSTVLSVYNRAIKKLQSADKEDNI